MVSFAMEASTPDMWGRKYPGSTKSIPLLLMPGSLRNQDIKHHDIDYVWYVKVLIVLYEEGFQLPVPCQCGWMV